MASRQTQYNKLSETDRKEQEEWAKKQLQLGGTCVVGFAWVRVERGYRCSAGNDLVTEEPLAEGKGGYYQTKIGQPFARDRSRQMNEFTALGRVWEGPQYGTPFKARG
jgi:hypothetical protein